MLANEYLAALLDGEGHIRLQEGGRARIAISNTYEPVIKEVLNTLGFGRIDKRNPRKKEHKALFTYWTRNNLETQIFLAKVLPYLVIKQEKAKEALDFIQKHSGGKRYHKGLEWQKYQEREECARNLILSTNKSLRAIAKESQISLSSVVRLKRLLCVSSKDASP